LNKMVFSAGSSSLPQPGQIFMVGSITWVVNADGVGELLEPVRICSAPTTLAPATANPMSKPLSRSAPSATHRSLPCYQRRHVNNDDLIESIDQVGLKLADCLSIAESALDTLVQHRAPSDPDLSTINARQTPGPAALPFGLANTATTYQDALRGKFADQLADQFPPTVNMLHAGRDLGASLQTILEENPDSESQGSTEPLAETFTKQPPLLPFRGGAIFNVSIDSPPGTVKQTRNALPIKTGTSTVRNAVITNTPLRWPRLLMITSSTHKEGPSIATSTKNSSALMATTSSKLRAPI